jgi:hypothetical protein
MLQRIERNLEYISFAPHQLVSKWLAAVEKVRYKSPLRDSVIVVYDWIIDGPRNSKGELFDDNAFVYSFNRVIFDTYLRSQVKRQHWEQSGVFFCIYLSLRSIFLSPKRRFSPKSYISVTNN